MDDLVVSSSPRIRPMVNSGGDEFYVLWCSTVQYRGISKARAEYLAQVEVISLYPNADRRRIKREIRKAVERMEW